MRHCLKQHVRGAYFDAHDVVRVADIGGGDYNGSYRQLFDHPKFEYLAVDIDSTRGVEVVMTAPDHIPFPDCSIDVLISGQMLEHCDAFWLVFAEMARVLAADGFMVVIAPSAGPIHRYPVDCYRFYPDSFHALARLTNLQLVELFHDDRGPWNDLVGVFRHRSAPSYSSTVNGGAEWTLGEHQSVGDGPWDEDPRHNVVRAAPSYLDVLASVHETLQPRGYLEIGVRNGASLALARCPAVGIDPAPDLTVALPPTTSVVELTSYEFFRALDGDLGLTLDLAFIDGAHLIEEVLKDFIAVESLAHERAVIVIDDVLPAHPLQAQRRRATRVWCGDVWKIVGCLRRLRPDLTLTIVDAAPCALLVVSNLNPQDRTLRQSYNPIVRCLRESDAYSPTVALAGLAPIDPRSRPFTELIELAASRP
ncbi:MAG: methyltransferase domain-containing protein [Solirubrobacteraceae bacterium]|jgi:SAM-dependent methyltransferase